MTIAERMGRVLCTVREAGRLPLREGVCVVWAGALLCWYRLRLALPWRFSAQRLVLQLASEGAGGPHDCEDAVRRGLSAGRVAELCALAASSACVGTPCVVRSLTLRRLLRAQGLSPRVVYGLRCVGGEVSGHTWVMHEGALVGDRDEFVARYVPLTSGRTVEPVETPDAPPADASGATERRR